MELTTAVSEGSRQEQLPESNRHRRRRLLAATTAAVALVVVAAAVGVALSEDAAPARRVASVAGPAPSTTTAPDPATTVPDDAGGNPDPSTGAGAPEPATAPKSTAPTRPAVSPDRARPAGITYQPQAVWPETLAELDRLQAAVDQGSEPWRNDPVGVARAYLLDRGLPAPGLAAFRSDGADAGTVDYTAGGAGGTVHMQRLLKGSIWYVSSSRTARLPGVSVARQSGSLVIEVQSGAQGTLSARAKRPGGEWGYERSRQVFSGGHGSVTLGSGEMFGEFILQLRLDSGGGRAGVTDAYLGSAVDGFRYTAADSGSLLRVDGLGPVRIGMTLDEARAASGLPLVTTEGPYCGGYRSDGPPTGLSLVSLNSGRLDFIDISEPTVATVSGIRVGSTVDDVRRAYGARLGGQIHDGTGMLVFRPDDPALRHLSLSLWIRDGKVLEMRAGLRGPVEADEPCA